MQQLDNKTLKKTWFVRRLIQEITLQFIALSNLQMLEQSVWSQLSLSKVATAD